MQSFWKESFKSTAKLLKGTADKVFSIVVYSRKQRILKKKNVSDFGNLDLCRVKNKLK